MSRKVFVDTSALLAYYLADEPDHIRIKSLIKRAAKEGIVFLTSNDVIDETITHLIYNTNHKIVEKFINYLSQSLESGSVIQFWVDEHIQSEAFDLVKKFSEHKLSLTDATSIALMNKHSIETIISLDSDFIKVGIATWPKFLFFNS